MKNKLRLTERNLINLIKKIISEQTPEEIAAQYGRDVNLNLLPNYATAQPGTQPTTQPTAQLVTQPTAQPVAQRQVACPTGYRQKTQGPYGLCDQSPAIQKLQKQFNITPDGKLGPMTLKFIREMLGDPKKTQITDEEINTYIKQSTPDAVGATNAQTTTNQQLSTGGLVLKINKNTKSLGVINQAYTKGGKIILTNNKGDEIYDTTCQLLTTKPAKFNSLSPQSIGYVQSINNQSDNGIVNSIYNYFCKNTNRIDVTKAINDDLNNPSVGLKKTYPTIKLRGTRFIAEKNKNSIWIKNENNETLFFTACGQNLDNGFFKFNFNISKELQTANLAVKLSFTKAAVQNLCPKKA